MTVHEIRFGMRAILKMSGRRTVWAREYATDRTTQRTAMCTVAAKFNPNQTLLNLR